MPPLLLDLLPIAFALVAATELALTLNALRPARHEWLVYQSFLASWWVGELALHHMVWQTLVAIGFVVAGAVRPGPWRAFGWIGLASTGLSLLGLAVISLRSRRHARATEDRIRDELGVTPESAPYPRWHLLIPLAAFARRDVQVTRGVEFCTEHGARLRVDIYRSRTPPAHGPCPALVAVHGGAWVFGFKRFQSIPMLTHLAANGWICFNVDYRLSPRVTFPDHLIDIKRAIAWVREHADDYGVDREFVALSGNSAGGHLAALAALTANDPRYQPGFETADTHVDACVAVYGVYDLTDRHHRKPRMFHRFLERMVFKASYRKARQRFEEASPIDHIHVQAPPFLLVHGADDGVALVEDARLFAESLRSHSSSPVYYIEVPGAGHLFDVFPSLRARVVTEATERFLRSRYRQFHPEGRHCHPAQPC